MRGARPGSTMSALNCLLRALQEIENPQERASRTGYHVVRIDPQKGDRPALIASPNLQRMNVSLKQKPYPITKKYMNQKLHADFFNVSFRYPQISLPGLNYKFFSEFFFWYISL